MKRYIFKKGWLLAVGILMLLLLPVQTFAEGLPQKNYTVQNGRLCDENGSAYTGWRTENSRKFYYVNGKKCNGWRKVGKRYYYFEGKNGLAKNKIVGSKKMGYYYVDKNGIRVTNKEVNLAVDFVMKNSDPKARRRQRLRQCFDALCEYPYFARAYEVKASKLPSFEKEMLTTGRGDCYYYGTTMAYIARVLGYDSRVAGGGVTARGPWYPMSEHGWCEVRIGSSWRMIDCSMQRAHTNHNLFLVKRSNYPFWLRCDKTYALKIKDGKPKWNECSNEKLK